jgi:3-methyladenine DNA glycosylase/8-oxoguanine DNA glycosylase
VKLDVPLTTMPEELVRFTPPFAINLVKTLGPLKRGRFDRTASFGGSDIWRATRTPDGPATQRISSVGGQIESQSWGPGAQWLAQRAPVLVGCHDDTADFPAANEAITRLHQQHQSFRILCTQNIWEALFPSVLEQKVTGVEARRSYAHLLRHFGEPAPRPEGAPPLVLPPDGERVAQSPSYVFHAAGVEAKRGDTIRRAATYAHRLREAAEMPTAAANALVSKLPGIGAWTVAEVGIVALGDADAVSVGDYHLKNWVSWNLAGHARGTDEEMLALLEPYRPHRGRVLKYLQMGGQAPPRYGPRLTIQTRY